MKVHFHTLASLLTVLWMLSCVSSNFGQNLLLPGPSQFVQGTGQCSDLVVGLHSVDWRVRKGDVFEVNAVQPGEEKSNLRFVWTVTNGKIVAGQGTSRIRVKAGGKKTPGFVNVSGFVEVALQLEKDAGSNRCGVEAVASIMVGRHRERNLVPNVDELVLDRSELTLCVEGKRRRETQEAQSESVVNVFARASDPENDVLSYNYGVSAGKITGNGATVKWDLSGVSAGTYRIFVGVDDGFGVFGKTQWATVTVVECKSTS